MLNRKQFLKTGLLGAIPFAGIGCTNVSKFTGSKPVVIATWNTAIKANVAAWEILDKGGYALDAVEAGVRVEEDDPKICLWVMADDRIAKEMYLWMPVSWTIKANVELLFFYRIIRIPFPLPEK